MFLNNRRRSWLIVACIGLLAVCVVLDSRLVKGEDAYATVESNLEQFAETLKLLSNSYYRPLDPDSLTASAIDGMVDDLDPYTQFLQKRSYEELMIDTRGKFGGLGITISLHGGDVPVVLSVIEGTPADTAGLQMGDRIVKIESDSTHGQTLQEVVDKLRGTPGEPVTITVERPGDDAPFDQHIVRGRIPIRSVHAIDNLDPEVGYICMSNLLVNGSRFTETTPQELERAIGRLKEAGARSVILDLRGNPGGLLAQAVDVADKFLDAGLPVVSTKGRVASQNQEYKTRSPSVLNGMPLAVLVDGHSASASEIVAGAIQDSDRGLIVGLPTFGKGSVQSFRDVGGKRALKWTTALYYTPSGRSIHRVTRRRPRAGGPVVGVGDKELPAWQVLAVIGESENRDDAVFELTERFDLAAGEAEQLMDIQLSELTGQGLRGNEARPEGTDPEKEFVTRGGRKVFGGGGIAPDVEVQPDRPPRVVLALRGQGMFFDFAVDYAAHNELPDVPDGYTLPDSAVDAFYAFIEDTTRSGSRFRYHTAAEVRLRELEQTMDDGGAGGAAQAMDDLKAVVEKGRQAEMDEARPFIRTEIERMLARRLWGTRGFILASLKADKQYHEAVAILKDPARYQKSMHLAVASEK